MKTCTNRISLLSFLSFAAILTVSVSFAHATPISFSLIGVETNKGTITGTVDIDSITKQVTAANITFNDAAAGSPVYFNVDIHNAYNGLGQSYISGPSNGPLNWGGQIALYYDTANIGLGALDICVHGVACGTEFNQASYAQIYSSHADGGPIFITDGSLAPRTVAAVVTPEPLSLFLLGTGILFVAVLAYHGLGKPKSVEF